MPHSTHAYAFESKVWDFAQRLSFRMTGQAHHTFLMLFDATGEARTLHFECPAESWHTLKARLDETQVPYLFYDPFDAPEYTWLSWSRIERSVMERLIGGQFHETDFGKGGHGPSRAPDLEPPSQFPASWGVMF